MKFKVLDTVVLRKDIPEHGLCRGDLGAIVEACETNKFDVEFVTASGKTQALVTLAAKDIRSVEDYDLIAVRTLQHTR
jgi:hypothetical protein